MLGGFLALLSAAAFALNNAAARRGVLSGTVLQAMAISVPFGVPFFLGGLLFFGSLDDLRGFSWRAIGWLAAAGVIHFILGRYANYRAHQGHRRQPHRTRSGCEHSFFDRVGDRVSRRNADARR